MNKKEFQEFITRKIRYLETGQSDARENLADLKTALGKDIEELPSLWGLVYDDYSIEKWQEYSDKKSNIEQAIVDTLALYAIHTRNNPRPHSDNSENTFPKYLVAMRKGEANQPSFDNKVGKLLVSDNYDRAVRLIGNFISQAKSTTAQIDYAALGYDLYNLSAPWGKDVLFSWGRAYHSLKNAKTKNQKSTK